MLKITKKTWNILVSTKRHAVHLLCIKRNTNDYLKLKILNTEDNFFRSFLKSKTIYHKYLAYQPLATPVNLNKTLSARHPLDIIEILNTFQHIESLPLEERRGFFIDKTMVKFLKYFIQVNFDKLPEEEFIHALKTIGTLEISKYIDLLVFPTELQLIQNLLRNKLARDCAERAASWNIETLVVAADLMITLHTSFTDYVNDPYIEQFWIRINQICSSKKSQLSPKDVVAILFHACVKRSLRFELSNKLFHFLNTKVLTELSVEVCGLICIALHKTETFTLDDKFSLALVLNLKKKIHLADDMVLQAFFKYFNGLLSRKDYKTYSQTCSALADLVYVIGNEIVKHDFQTFLRILLCYRNMRLITEKLQNLFIDRIKHSNLSTARAKELSLIVLLLGTFQIKFDGQEDILNSVQERFLSSSVNYDNGEKDLHHLSKFINGMLMLNYYPESLINKCFTMKINLDKLRVDSRHQLFIIDQSTRIERPDYEGRLLPYECVKQFQKDTEKRNKATLSSHQSRLLSDVMQTLSAIYEGHYIRTTKPIPYNPNAEIEMWFDENGPVPFTKENKQSNSVKRLLLAIISRSSYFTLQKLDGTKCCELLGQYQMKLRQMRTLGYTVIPVAQIEYYRAEDKQLFLKDLICRHMEHGD